MSNLIKNRKRDNQRKADKQKAKYAVDYLTILGKGTRDELAALLQEAATNPLLQQTIIDLNRPVAIMGKGNGMDLDIDDTNTILRLTLDYPDAGRTLLAILQHAADLDRR